MSVIDQRIVEMKFDNSKFADGVKSTMSMLDRLKTALSFKGGSAGLDELQASANRFSMANVTGTLTGVGGQITTLGMTAANVFGNIITDGIYKMNAALGQFTTKPIRDGLAEYEMNMGSIQTILTNTQSKGSTLKDVTASLDDLNTYADKTVYSFSEMTKNIGTFTAAGVGLDDATTAIKGISNLGAASGSNSGQVASAMYQMSQALAAGKVGLMDWNSLVNAGMGGQLMQDALKETSRALGTGADAAIEKAGSFRDSLQEGWITADVLRQTFANFSGDIDESSLLSAGYTQEQIDNIKKQAAAALEAATVSKTFSDVMDTTQESLGSGWAKTWQILIGDFEEAKKLWTAVGTELTGIFDAMGDKRNAFLEQWKALRGRTKVLEAIGASYKALKSSMIDMGKGFASVAPSLDPAVFAAITSKVSTFIQALVKSGNASVAFRQLGEGFGHVLKGLLDLLGPVARMIGIFFDAFKKGDPKIEPGNPYGLTSFQKAVKGVGDVLETVGKYFQRFAHYFEKTFDFTKFSVMAHTIRSAFATSFKVLGLAVETVITVFKRLTGNMDAGSAFGSAMNFVVKIVTKVAQAIVNFNNDILRGNSIFSGFGDKLIKMAAGLKAFLGSIDMGGFFNAVGTRLGQLSGLFSAFGSVAQKVLSFFIPSWQGFGTFLSGLGTLLGAVFGGMIEGFKSVGRGLSDVFSSDNFSKILDAINTGLFLAITLMLKNFLGGGSLIDQIKEKFFGGGDNDEEDSLTDKIKAFLVGKDDDGGVIEGISERIKGAIEPLTDTLDAMQQTLKAATLMQIAIAIGILTASVVALSTLDSAALTKSLTAMTVMFGQLAGMLYLIQMMALGKTALTLPFIAAGLVGIATSILILSAAVSVMSNLSWEELLRGLAGLAGTMLILVAAVKPLSASSGGMAKAGAGLIVLSIGVNLLVTAVKRMSGLNWEELIRGLVGLAGVFVALAVFTKIAAVDKMGATTGAGLMLLASGVVILAAAMKLMASISIGDTFQSLLALSGALGILTLAVRAMPKNLPVVALGLNLLGTALVIISGALLILSTLSIGDTWQSLLLLGGALGILSAGVNTMSGALAGAAAMLIVTAALSVLVPVLITLGTMPWQIIAAGIVALAATFGVFAAAGYLLTPVVPTLLGLAAAIGILGLSILAVMAGLTVFIAAIALLISSIAALATVGTGALKSLIALIPELIASIGEGIIALFQLIADSGTAIVDMLVTIFQSILTSIQTLTPQIIETMKGLLLAILQMVIDITPTIIETLRVLLTEILQLVIDMTPLIVEAFITIVRNILDALVVLTPDVVAAGVAMVTALVEGIVAMVTYLVDAGMRLIIGVLDGINRNLPLVISKGVDVITTLIDGIARASLRLVNSAAEALLMFLNGFADAIRRYSGQFRAAGLNVATAIIDGITGGLASKVGSVVQAAKNVADNIPRSIRKLLGINSPSRVMRDMMQYVGDGIVVGLGRQEGVVGKAASRLGDNTVRSMKEALSGAALDLPSADFNPVIRPVVDLSDVTKASNTIADVFGKKTVGLSGTKNLANGIANDSDPSGSINKSESHVTNVNFVQNNSSPESLSHGTIFRQTKNQLAMFKKELGV